MCKNHCHDGHCHSHNHNHGHSHDHNHDHHNHNHDDKGGRIWSTLREFIPEAVTLVLLIIALMIDWGSYAALAYIVALLPVGAPILVSTFKEWMRGDIFNEFTLMVLASLGAFFIGEYPEGVAVLLFYSLGEKLEDVVSGDVKGQIRRLLGKLPKQAVVLRDGARVTMRPQEVEPGMLIAVKPGESVPLDGIVESDGEADFNTAAITGESLPRTYAKGDAIDSGIIPVVREVQIRVTNSWNDSSMTRIMQMIEDASSHRAPSETILRRITRWYTPVVFGAALLLFFVPWLVSLVNTSFIFEWEVWLRRSLVFLVCSCPCALIVSIPLTYFASIGIASKKGILFKGHDSLDALRKVNTVLLDKTGTVTTGEFHVRNIEMSGNFTAGQVLAIAAAVETGSPHPLAKAITAQAEADAVALPQAVDTVVVEHGMKSTVGGKEVIIGSRRLMEAEGIRFPADNAASTAIYVAVNGLPAGVIILSDTVKTGVSEAVSSLHKHGVSRVGILSGDTENAVKDAAESIGADTYKAELLPGDKQRIISECKSDSSVVAFAGDGVNDAPALAAADVGIAMGHVGTDIAIEAARVVMAGDDLRKISEGMDISARVRNVVWENVCFAFGVKLIVMVLGAFGIATLWAAVFADTGVTVITILWTLWRLKIWQLKR